LQHKSSTDSIEGCHRCKPLLGSKTRQGCDLHDWSHQKRGKISLSIADVDCSLVTEGKVLTTARVRHYRLRAE
jgi:hypothetical protein